MIDYLSVVVVRVLLVDEVDVFLRAIIEGESLDVVTLYGLCLVNNTLTLIGDFRLEETLPLTIGEVEVVEFLQLEAKVLYQLVLVVDMGILVALSLKLGYHPLLQLCLALVSLGTRGGTLVLGHHRALGVL